MAEKLADSVADDDQFDRAGNGSLNGEPNPPSSKEKAIERACHEKNLDELVRLADSPGGLLNDRLRRVAWPILLGGAHDGPAEAEAVLPDLWRSLPPHREEGQVKLDVDRAFVYYPSDETEKTSTSRKMALSNLIVQVLRTHPMLSYFQGYHDIVQVLLLVLGEQEAPMAVARVSLLRIRDFMLPSLHPVLEHLQFLPAILRSADPELSHTLVHTSPLFALSAFLTLYAHDVEDYRDIARLYDFILAHEPLMSLYLFAAMIISRRSDLLAIPADEQDMVYFTLAKLPRQSLDLDALIPSALAIFQKYPPQKLAGPIWWQRTPGLLWWWLSSLSVLKTARSLSQQESLEDGERLLAEQIKQMRRKELQSKALLFLSRNRRPILSFTTAVVVGVVSIWLRSRGHDRMLWTHMTRVLHTFQAAR